MELWPYAVRTLGARQATGGGGEVGGFDATSRPGPGRA